MCVYMFVRRLSNSVCNKFECASVKCVHSIYNTLCILLYIYGVNKSASRGHIKMERPRRETCRAARFRCVCLCVWSETLFIHYGYSATHLNATQSETTHCNMGGMRVMMMMGVNCATVKRPRTDELTYARNTNKRTHLAVHSMHLRTLFVCASRVRECILSISAKAYTHNAQSQIHTQLPPQ